MGKHYVKKKEESIELNVDIQRKFFKTTDG